MLKEVEEKSEMKIDMCTHEREILTRLRVYHINEDELRKDLDKS